MSTKEVNSICIDLDGTLLNSEKHIGELSKESIASLKGQGKRIVLASGRHFVEIKPFVDELQLTDNDYVISCDGQYIHSIDGKVIWRNDLLCREQVAKVIRNIDDVGSLILVTDKHDYFFTKSIKKFIARIVKHYKNKERYILPMRVCLPCEMEKIIWNDSSLEILEKLQKIKSIRCIYYANEDKYDIVPRNVNKYVALSHLFGVLNEDLEKTLYFGDAINDLDCFEHLKYTVAVGNAIEDVKMHAWQIAKSNDEDGVGVWLKEMIDSK